MLRCWLLGGDVDIPDLGLVCLNEANQPCVHGTCSERGPVLLGVDITIADLIGYAEEMTDKQFIGIAFFNGVNKS